MSVNEDGIVRGPEAPPVPRCSVAEYFLPKLKALPRDDILQVESDTGVTQTCGEFLKSSIRMSEVLRKLGVEEEDVVALLSRNCIQVGEIVLATWLRGAVIAPVNGSMKIPELEHFLGLVKPKFLFCEEGMKRNVCAALDMLSLNPVILTTDTEDPRLAGEDLEEVDVESYEARPVKSPATQLAAILPSSGTSGPSKGVGITHTNLIFQDQIIRQQKVLDTHSCLVVSHLFWVTGMLMLIVSFSKGMKRILMKDASPTNILKAIDEQKPERFIIAPVPLVVVSNSPDFGQYDVSSVRTILVGGAPFTPGIAEKLRGKWVNATFIQGYGTTEVSGLLLLGRETRNVFSMGTVMPGVQIKIVDLETGKNLGANRTGEIRVKSPGIMKWYVDNEKATRNAFDEFGWVRTGDLGYYDDSGQFYIVDRIADILKVMNMQVSPTEIENELIRVPGVAEVAVTGVTHDEYQYVAALVVKQKGASVTEEDIHAHVARTMSDYKKLTGGVYFLESIPKTATGKVQKSEIRKLAQSLYSSFHN